ncbi:dihydropteroate synthase [Thermobacillus composti KWC4]|uniref:Dihydropteroate synthase n=1 Tax=Thermobacillus composti (strain DSM 18247 / JCM 13945 / KWC4) TaxID=717605 RepID=L0EJ89_THECK|nr:dihydropteroate synthase [Thermobacillus composti]AGA59684.1 dihydropteroate synthase [Thermobacillus composti KWC4]
MRPVFWSRTYELAGGVNLELGRRTLVMGILNVTPDSFSDGGRYLAVDAAVEHAVRMVEAGADILDIGGESTRPGHEPVPADEEIRRVIPVIRAVREALPHVPLSIDTYKAETARKALEAGVHIINDIWGLAADPEMARTAAEFGCPVVISHNRRETGGYADIARDVAADLLASVRTALDAGVDPYNIWLDPGIGFAKEYEDNLDMMGRLAELVRLGYPVLLGTSRKRFIRHTLDLPTDDVVEGTAATVALGIAQGCQVVRVHDVDRIVRTVRMTDAVVYRQADIRGEAGVPWTK